MDMFEFSITGTIVNLTIFFIFPSIAILAMLNYFFEIETKMIIFYYIGIGVGISCIGIANKIMDWWTSDGEDDDK